jgi:anti-sigma factor RsiW
MSMECQDARHRLNDLRRGRLVPAAGDEVERHLAECLACRRAQESEAALDDLVERAAPRIPAPPALRQRLWALVAAPGAGLGSAPRRWRRLATPALAASLALTLGGVLVERQRAEASQAGARITDELINDHLRVLVSQRPAEVESGGPHQVKPWFEGKLDFAPVVPASGPGELQLRGGSIGYVLDRRAAVLQYTLRLHRLTLLVVRAEGLPWPDGAPGTATARGFQVIRWRAGELGYALVSDVNARELGEVAGSFQAATGR